MTATNSIETAAAPEPAMEKFLLVGAGAHAKRTYIPHLKTLREEGRAYLKVVVDIERCKDRVEDLLFTKGMAPDAELVLVPAYDGPMPVDVAARLNEVVARTGVTCAVISTEPLAHKSYGLWAVSAGLNIIMDKPISTRNGAVTDFDAAFGIAEDYQDLADAYEELRKRQIAQGQKPTFFQMNSHRRYHPGFYCTFDMIKEIQEKTRCPVTNIISTHCDGKWRMPSEIVDEPYHPYRTGYGKVSHSGYHFFDMIYNFMRSGWSDTKRPDKMEISSSFVLPAGFVTTLNEDDYDHIFGKEEYAKWKKYTDEELMKLMGDMGEIDASIQVTFSRGGHAIAIAQINLLHNGFSRRSWLQPGADLYKGNGRVKHEAHEIRSGPLQTIVIDSRQANDKHDRSKPSTGEIGTDNHFEVHVFRNHDITGDEAPLKTFTVADLDRRYNTAMPGIYSENVKRGILWEAVDFLHDKKTLPELTSNLADHAIPAYIMSAAYISHIRRTRGLDPTVPIELAYGADGLAKAHIAEALYRPFETASDASSATDVDLATPLDEPLLTEASIKAAKLGLTEPLASLNAV
ncbi:hypothetical protein COL5a_010852 [Colletotrichum fioriniae]|uniref:uncharacterized protein n=1 Tax=Colletotrichum fioriniae TaxID=710243 RepID=UPI002300DCFB|nr:uncharacterized protein COL516b_006378 [Colletotrichum fioriniae]KAJ0303933.1 hypothetical protein COL516b_006378 [Colletotrichum fioriniae]KAJ0318103.1 hypothetical protein COL5a_010852 [Colletotrichum fioriniae]KAJ3949585.1 hypothetical protein N0V96_000706 [Colletotrichum fioriniae]